MQKAISHLGSNLAGQNKFSQGRNNKREALETLRNNFQQLIKSPINDKDITTALNKFWGLTAEPRSAWYSFKKADYGNTASSIAFKNYINTHGKEELKSYMKNITTDYPKEDISQHYLPTNKL